MSFSTKTFNGEPGFCSHCGTILPHFVQNTVECYVCKRLYGPEAFQNIEASYTIQFNSYDEKIMRAKANEKEVDGPVVERKCPACGNDNMSYATLQLRSADEGQTVFYTCTRCKFKETENS